MFCHCESKLKVVVSNAWQIIEDGVGSSVAGSPMTPLARHGHTRHRLQQHLILVQVKVRLFLKPALSANCSTTR